MSVQKTYAYTSDIFSLSGNVSDQKNIMIDSNFAFRCEAINIYATSANARMSVEYNSDEKLSNQPVYFDTIANVNNKGEVKINPFLVSANTTIRVNVINDSGAVNVVQVVFVGLRIYEL